MTSFQNTQKTKKKKKILLIIFAKQVVPKQRFAPYFFARENISRPLFLRLTRKYRASHTAKLLKKQRRQKESMLVRKRYGIAWQKLLFRSRGWQLLSRYLRRWTSVVINMRVHTRPVLRWINLMFNDNKKHYSYWRYEKIIMAFLRISRKLLFNIRLELCYSAFECN